MTAAANTQPPPLRRRPDFRRLWLANTVSQLGTQVSELAIPLTAILLLHAGPLQVGLLATMGYLPLAVLGLPAGAWADRRPRRTIMVTADVIRGLALASIPISYLLHKLSIDQLYLVALLVGGLSVFFDVASSAYLPSLVASNDLARANSRLQVSEQGAAVVGPGLAGWLVGLIGAPLAIAADATSYLASAAFLKRIRHRESPPSAAGHTRLRTEIGEGLRAVATNRQLRGIALAAAITNLFGRMIVILLPIYLVHDAHYQPTVIGLVFATGSVGFLVGAATADNTIRRLGLGPSILAGGTIVAASFLLIAFAPADLVGPFTAGALLVYGIGALTFAIANATLRQLTVPSRLLGRTTSSMRLLIWIAQPAAGLLAAWLGTRVGLHTTLLVGALGAALTPIPLLTAGLIGQRNARVSPNSPATNAIDVG
jgi:MFS family permease